MRLHILALFLFVTSFFANKAAAFSGRRPVQHFLNKNVTWRTVHGVDGEVQIPTLFQSEYETLTPHLQDCLAGKHVAMMGYSLVRYQYLSLANFIQHGEWLPWDGSAYRGFPSPVIENQWRGNTSTHWNAFFKGTNALLENSEACDCYRVPSCRYPPSSKGWCNTENRYYRKSVFGNGKAIALTYLSSFGKDRTPRGHWLMSQKTPVAPSEQSCSVGDCKPPWRWVYTDADAVKFILKPLKVTHLMWSPNNERKGVMPDANGMLSAARLSLSPGSTGILYEGALSASSNAVHIAPHIRLVSRKVAAAGWENLHSLRLVHKLRKSFQTKHASINDGQRGKPAHAAGTFLYWDSLHYYPWVYEELNKALLSIICKEY